MPGIGQRVVRIAFERHVTFGIEADSATGRNYCANVMIVTEMTQTGEAGSFESATQNNVIEDGAVAPYLQVFQIVGMTNNKLIELNKRGRDRYCISANSRSCLRALPLPPQNSIAIRHSTLLHRAFKVNRLMEFRPQLSFF